MNCLTARLIPPGHSRTLREYPTVRVKGIVMQPSLLSQFLTCLFWIIAILTTCYLIVFAIRLVDDVRSAVNRLKKRFSGLRR